MSQESDEMRAITQAGLVEYIHQEIPSGLFYCPDPNKRLPPFIILNNTKLFPLAKIFGPRSEEMTPTQVLAHNTLREQLMLDGQINAGNEMIRQIFNSAIDELSSLRERLTVLEIGFGAKPLAAPKNGHYWGVEIDQKALHFAIDNNRYPKRQFISPSELERIPNHSVDLVVASFVSPFPFQTKQLHAILECMKKDGVMLVNTLQIGLPLNSSSVNAPPFVNQLQQIGLKTSPLADITSNISHRPTDQRSDVPDEYGRLHAYWIARQLGGEHMAVELYLHLAGIQNEMHWKMANTNTTTDISPSLTR